MVIKKYILNIERDFVESADIIPFGKLITNFLNVDEENTKHNKGNLIISFDGYDNDERELSEIKEVKEYAKMILTQYPEILYFLDEDSQSLQNILLIANDLTIVKKDGCDTIKMYCHPDKHLMSFVLSSFIHFCIINRESRKFVKDMSKKIMQICSLSAEDSYLDELYSNISNLYSK